MHHEGSFRRQALDWHCGHPGCRRPWAVLPRPAKHCRPLCPCTLHSYMTLKNSKLHEQFEANSLVTEQRSGIFRGVAIYVNGHTEPPALRLRELMMQHGGRFDNFRETATHIVCTHLPDTKVKQLAHQKWVRISLRLCTVLSGHPWPQLHGHLIAPFL